MAPRQSEFMTKLTRGYKRVNYKNNPLIEVIYQLRFPQLLAIDDKPPSDFQNRIIKNFPILEISSSIPLFVGTSELKPVPAKAYTFFSSDRHSKVSLTSSFISVSTDKYTRWEDFIAVLRNVILAFRKSLPEQQDRTTRMGLRYRNVIDRKAIGKANSKWDELINPQLLGLLKAGVMPETTARSAHCLYTLDFGDVTSLFQHGLWAQAEATGYFLDYDFYIEKEQALSLSEVMRLANDLHKWVGPLFRWSITDNLHGALKPSKL
jgi:uncharacterized protein (TIGR04255 family)